jgi:hypothetical protein
VRAEQCQVTRCLAPYSTQSPGTFHSERCAPQHRRALTTREASQTVTRHRVLPPSGDTAPFHTASTHTVAVSLGPTHVILPLRRKQLSMLPAHGGRSSRAPSADDTRWQVADSPRLHISSPGRLTQRPSSFRSGAFFLTSRNNNFQLLPQHALPTGAGLPVNTRFRMQGAGFHHAIHKLVNVSFSYVIRVHLNIHQDPQRCTYYSYGTQSLRVHQCIHQLATSLGQGQPPTGRNLQTLHPRVGESLGLQETLQTNQTKKYRQPVAEGGSATASDAANLPATR